jgi:hypothetical protein
MKNAPDDEAEVDLDIDQVATRRARAEIERVFAEHKIPGTLRGDLFCFDFADLVGRVEILQTQDPAQIHAHMTVSGPKLAVPVLDCWAAFSKDGADALAHAISQWAEGPYWAYHDAFAHDHEPTYVVAREPGSVHVFEAPLQWYGQADSDALAKLGVTRSLVERVRLSAASDLRAHRLRWVHGINGIGEVFLDDEARPELKEALNAFDWPEKLILVRHSAVLLPAKLSKQREPANLSLGETYELLSKASGVADVDSIHSLRGSLQHGIELAPCDERIPRLCQRWTQLLAQQLQDSHVFEPRDVPMSRGLIEAYARMLAGNLDAATEWLNASLKRASGLEAQSTSHVSALANLFCESALPQRHDAVINGARKALAINDPVVSCATSSIEAPSAIASMREIWPNLKISFGDFGTPDPRRARARNAVSLWSYKAPRLWDRVRGVLGIEAWPVVAPPSARTTDAVSRVAELPFSREAWQSPCRQLAVEVSELSELFAVMVHPPRSSSRPPWDWRFHVMTAATLAIGHLVNGDASTAGDHPLVRLLDGPVDWSTTAAVIALCDVALRRPDFASAIIRELNSRLKHPVTPVWYQCYMQPARWAVLRLMQIQ